MKLKPYVISWLLLLKHKVIWYCRCQGGRMDTSTIIDTVLNIITKVVNKVIDYQQAKAELEAVLDDYKRALDKL